jgi:uncharacterized membrane protein (Fun14 family)
MADISHHASDITAHPDVAEMRERYEKVDRGSAGRRNVVVDGVILLAGLYLAISPWVVHVNTVSTSLTVTNLVLGLGLAVLGFGLAYAPERFGRLVWTCIPIGVFAIGAPWITTVGHTATHTMIWNNSFTGAVVTLAGLIGVGVIAASRFTISRSRAAR